MDTLGRRLRSLRISVTDRCNLRCQYCMPAEIFGKDFQFLPRSGILSFEEIAQLMEVFISLGVGRIRITGGEPLLRRDLPVLIKQLRTLDQTLDIALTTNGTALGKLALPLREAGLNRVNVSLDAIDDEIAAIMAGQRVDTKQIWANILQARESGLGVKVNCVLKRGVNEHQAIPLAERCREHGVTLRFIEYMDVGETNQWKSLEVVTGQEVMDQLSERWPLRPVKEQEQWETARRYTYADGAAEVGFINSISEPFCRGCDRARISAEGKLYTCLFAEQGVSLRDWIRDEELSPDDLYERLAALWLRREDRYSEIRGSTSPAPTGERPEMWKLGG